jgi:hypothetical protein
MIPLTLEYSHTRLKKRKEAEDNTYTNRGIEQVLESCALLRLVRALPLQRRVWKKKGYSSTQGTGQVRKG